MKRITNYTILLAILWAVSQCQLPEPPRPLAEKPNIVIVITDDQGYGDLGYHGNPYIQTPVLDDLARKSMRLQSFYVSPVCAPTRASLMTGRYAIRAGVYDTYNGGANLGTEETTMAEVFKENGYATGVFGKWHLGDNYPTRPIDQGFDYALVHNAGGMAQVGDVNTYYQFDSAYFDPILMENGEPVKRKGYCSDIFTDQAIDFISSNKDQPFLAYLSFNAPHTPLQLPGKYEAQYANINFDTLQFPQYDRPFPTMNEKDQADARKVYGMVSNIDDNLGRLRGQLEELGLMDNTIFIFMTDNGPQQRRYNGGMRGRKGSVYEGGIRVPFFIESKLLPQDTTIIQPVAHIDILPTLVDLCGLETSLQNLDGQSVLPYFTGKSVPSSLSDRFLFYEWQRGFPEPYRNVAVRHQNFKLVGQRVSHNAKPEELQLFDLSKDPGELHNLAKEQPGQAAKLKSAFDQWYEEIVANPKLGENHLVIGHPSDNPTILNRNDAKGSWGIWNQDHIYGYWDVIVDQDGLYTVTCHFRDTINHSGNVAIRIGKVQRTQDVSGPFQTITFEGVPLAAGTAMVESRFRGDPEGVIFPFYLKVERIE